MPINIFLLFFIPALKISLDEGKGNKVGISEGEGKGEGEKERKEAGIREKMGPGRLGKKKGKEGEGNEIFTVNDIGRTGANYVPVTLTNPFNE